MPGPFDQYITPPPPFLAGSDRLSQAITDIWQKRQNDEKNRIDAARQVEEGQYHQGANEVARLNAIESRRHSMATEGRDLSKDAAAYLTDVAKAYNAGNRQLGDALAKHSMLFGIAPQAMAARVAEVQAGSAAGDQGVPVQGDPNAATRGPEPGVIMGPWTPNNEAAIAGSQRMVPELTQVQADEANRQNGYAAPVAPAAPPVDTAAAPPGTTPLPQAAVPTPATAELNAQKPAAPPQPPAPAPQASAPMQAPVAPPQAAEAPPGDTSVRRPDIHIQPKPASQLGVEAPLAPGASPHLPTTAWANDLSQHPTVLGAEPGRDAENANVQAPPGPGGMPPPGAGAPGGVDPVTQRQWMQQHGVAGTSLMPNGDEIMAGNAEVTRQAMEEMRGYAQDNYEVSLAQNAAEAVARASQVMSPKEAYDKVSEQFFKALHEHRQDQRTNTNATAQAGRFDVVDKRIKAQNDAQNEFHRQEAAARAKRDRARVERDRLKAEALGQHHQDTREDAQTKDFLSRQNTILVHGRIAADRAAADTIVQLEKITTNPSSVDKELAKRLILVLGNNKGSTSNEDATASEGLPSRALEEKWADQITAALEGKTPNAMNDLRASVAKFKGVLLARTLTAYRAHRDSIIVNAPNDYARKQALANLRLEHKNFGWALGEFYLEDHPEARPPEWVAPPNSPTAPAPPAPSKPKAPKALKGKPKKPTVDDVTRELGGETRR